MFIVHFGDGTTIQESEWVSWDSVVDKGISSIQLVCPSFRNIQPVKISLGSYDLFYCAYQATSTILSISGVISSAVDMKPTRTHQVLAGIDLKRQEVVYINVDLRTNDVRVNKFDLEKFKVNQNCIRRGIITI